MAKLFENNSTRLSSPVTFIIGNGFDIGLGMKTRYSDIYDGYVKTPPASSVIQKFKEDLSQRTLYDKWSDFEMGMAEYAKTLASEDELVECVRDFKGYMVQHLRAENQRLTDLIRDKVYAEHLVQELDRSFDRFHESFAPNITTLLGQLIGGSFPEHNVITFNYTSVLEELYAIKAWKQKITEKAPLHIHGSLDRDVVLGVDNLDQLQNTAYSISRKGKRAFVKTLFNEQYDTARVSAAQKMISESTIICTYGFSLGESDKTWVNMIVDWLQSDSSHHLVVFQYDETEYSQYNFDELMDVEDAKKERFMAKLGITDEAVFEQIHIPVGFDIFNFKFVKVVGAKLDNPPFNIFETIGR